MSGVVIPSTLCHCRKWGWTWTARSTLACSSLAFRNANVDLEQDSSGHRRVASDLIAHDTRNGREGGRIGLRAGSRTNGRAAAWLSRRPSARPRPARRSPVTGTVDRIGAEVARDGQRAAVHHDPALRPRRSRRPGGPATGRPGRVRCAAARSARGRRAAAGRGRRRRSRPSSAWTAGRSRGPAGRGSRRRPSRVRRTRPCGPRRWPGPVPVRDGS